MNSQNGLNIFYINLILLTVAIDICENDDEKDKLYQDYKQFLFFFILASINLYQDNKTKIIGENHNILVKMINNIIGYGFVYLQKRDMNIYNIFKKELIDSIMKYKWKNALGNKKKFFKKSTIGKLFIIKDISKDDTNLGKNEKKKGKWNKKD